MDIDGRIRALQQGGRHQAAVELCIGNRPGQSDYAFNTFDSALERTLNINQAQFLVGSRRATTDLRGFSLLPPVIALVLMALAWLGLHPRLQEYRA